MYSKVKIEKDYEDRNNEDVYGMRVREMHERVSRTKPACVR